MSPLISPFTVLWESAGHRTERQQSSKRRGVKAATKHWKEHYRGRSCMKVRLQCTKRGSRDLQKAPFGL